MSLMRLKVKQGTPAEVVPDSPAGSRLGVLRSDLRNRRAGSLLHKKKQRRARGLSGDFQGGLFPRRVQGQKIPNTGEQGLS